MKRQSSPGTSIGQKKNIQAKEVYPRFFAVVVLVDVVVVFAKAPNTHGSYYTSVFLSTPLRLNN